ncbi:AraC family transcriptional regulator [Rhizobium oryzicola]|uniref:AraC family transcriptional regulator n=1 Tax=Rhizobium oryzicola TaxID=1232668 RepID=A0ABT8SUZ1_9HYPH|nr:AraC family transcriptional regulator [Rhizobium oryzicola]MDO1582240.1 AraC family transcriptional regulator [Rhizobium oryzicola]
MSARFNWNGFSEILPGDLFNDNLTKTERNGRFESTRKQFLPAAGDGMVAFVKTPDLRVLLVDCAIREEKLHEVTDEGLIRFHFNFDLSLETTYGHNRLESIVRHDAGIFSAPGDYVMQDRILPGHWQKFLTVACCPQWLKDFFGIDAASLLEQRKEETEGPFQHCSLHFNAAMREAVQLMLSGPQSASVMENCMNAAFITIKAQELVFHALEQARTLSAVEALLRPTDLRAAKAVLDLLEVNYAHPPSLADLSRKLGTNRTKLQQAFKQVHGETIGGATERLRMTAAQKLLINTDMSISHIAFEVGYAQLSSFSSRFKAYFGISPKELRRKLAN